MTGSIRLSQLPRLAQPNEFGRSGPAFGYPLNGVHYRLRRGIHHILLDARKAIALYTAFSRSRTLILLLCTSFASWKRDKSPMYSLIFCGTRCSGRITAHPEVTQIVAIPELRKSRRRYSSNRSFAVACSFAFAGLAVIIFFSGSAGFSRNWRLSSLGSTT
jgi:hypothetical protein